MRRILLLPALPIALLAVTSDGLSQSSQFAMIPSVPDHNQPLSSNFGYPLCTDGFCAPLSAVNVVLYWDVVQGHSNAGGASAVNSPEEAAILLSWFMATNSDHSPGCAGGGPRQWGEDGRNGGTPGTDVDDIAPGLRNFIRWDAGHAFRGVNAPGLPQSKPGTIWSTRTRKLSSGYPPQRGWAEYRREIDEGRPTIVVFSHWNLRFQAIRNGIRYYEWKAPLSDSRPLRDDCQEEGEENCPPVEEWDNASLGHAVTGVGYDRNTDVGTGAKDWIIVHDNWGSTQGAMAVPFLQGECSLPPNCNNRNGNWRAHVFVLVVPNQLPGDANQDGTFDLSDPITILQYLFTGDVPRLPCADGHHLNQANDELLNTPGQPGVIGLTTAVHMLNFLFNSGPPPVQGTACIPVMDCPDNQACSGS